MEIQSRTISYASFKKKETNKHENQLEEKINKLENKIIILVLIY